MMLSLQYSDRDAVSLCRNMLTNKFMRCSVSSVYESISSWMVYING